MSNVLIDRQKIDILANAISDKSGVPVTMTLDEMVEAVDSIETGGGNEPNLQAKTYTVDSAGTATVTADSGYDGLSSVAVSVPSAGNVSATLYKNDLELTVDNDTGVVSVYSNDIGGYIEADNSGWINVNQYSEIPNARVSYEINGSLALSTQSTTTISPSESQQTAVAKGKFTTGVVSVGAISSTYVGSGITRRSSTDLTASGATVTVPSGYYSAQASKAVASGTAGTPTATKGTVSNHSVSVTPSVTNTSGYISGGTINGTAVTVSASELVSGTYTVSASGTHDVTNYASASVASGSATAPASISGTSASITTGTNTITLTKTVSVTPSVTAGYVSSGTSGNSSVSLTASVTTKAAATITPTTTNQTIAAGTYLTGTQTIAGDADLVGSNILSTANIFGVQGTVVVQNYYTGSSAPSSSLGSNGDLYLQS